MTSPNPTRLRRIAGTVSWQRAGDVCVAITYLARARWWIARKPLKPLVKNGPKTGAPALQADPQIGRVAWAMPRAARLVPWRSTCLVQAVAARAWLDRHGIETRLELGMPTAQADQFEAHAWLTCGETVVTGGDVSKHTAFSSRMM